MKDVLDFGITKADFTDAQAQAAWGTIYDWYTKPETRGSVIELFVFQATFSTIPLQDMYPGETLESLCYLVRTNRIKREATQACVDLTATMQAPNADFGKAMAITNTRLSALIALGQTANSDYDSARGFGRQLQRIYDVRAGVNHAVAPWPWEPLQRETLGIQRDDYVVFYGRPKNMKSWVLAYLIAFFFEMEIPTVVYTKEMTPDNVYQRVVACVMRFAYQNFRLGNISDEELSIIRDFVYGMQNDPLYAQKLIVLSGRDVPSGADTVDWLKGKLEKYRPKVALVDGLYLLSSTSNSKQQKDNERVQSISRALRNVPLETGIPIIATNQANRAAAKNRDANTEEIAFSDALAQDATLAARVIADKVSPTVSIIIGGSREFKLHGFRINAIPAVDFTFHSELTEEDIDKAKAEDAAAEEEKKAKKRKRQPAPPDTVVDEHKEMLERVAEAETRPPPLPS